MWCTELDPQLDNDQIDAHMKAHPTNGMCGVMDATLEDVVDCNGWIAPCSSYFSWLQILSALDKISWFFLLEFEWIVGSCITSTSNAMSHFFLSGSQYVVSPMFLAQHGGCYNSG
jgi:hypothetical protein